MEVAEKAGKKRVFYSEHDVIEVPEDIPELGVERGDSGTIETLDFRSDNHIVAIVNVPFSTGQPRGTVEMSILPEEKVLAFETS
jgi:hypothetical protein